MPKKSIADKKAELEKQLKALEALEKAELKERQQALGAGIDAAIDADSNLKITVMQAIDTHLKNNKQRELLGLEKIATSKGRPATN